MNRRDYPHFLTDNGIRWVLPFASYDGVKPVVLPSFIKDYEVFCLQDMVIYNNKILKDLGG
jgi:hypothetical protein